MGMIIRATTAAKENGFWLSPCGELGEGVISSTSFSVATPGFFSVWPLSSFDKLRMRWEAGRRVGTS
jgi:hypothetical protein